MKTLSVQSENLRAFADLNGKAKATVSVVYLESGILLHADEFNPVVAKAREVFVQCLPEHFEAEGRGLLMDLASLVATERASAEPEKKEPQNLDVEPWGESIEGAMLLDSLSAFVRRYVHLPRETADAIAVWAVLTYCVDWVIFAPLLVLASASKRCGKTLVLALLTPIVRRGRLTSAIGVTPAVLFRLNHRDRPTFLLDEAEKLHARHADPELVGLINVGYRRGAKVQRCADSGGQYDIQDFEAFGFRVLAMIGKPWDTIADRSLIVPMERKPRTVQLERFRESLIEQMGLTFARQARRWVSDVSAELQTAYYEAIRPLWLGDRDCDNWAGLFAIANVAGSDWPQRIEAAARLLAGCREDDGDAGERLVHDTRTIFETLSEPPVIASGELVEKLNAIETSGWGELRDGRGLSTHSLASRFRPFEVKPRAARHPATDAMVRGYWLADLRAVFERYPAPEPAPGTSETVATLQAGERGAINEKESLSTIGDASTLEIAFGGSPAAQTVSSVAEVQEGIEGETYEECERIAIARAS